MNYSESILGTPLDDLSLDILTNYFRDPRKESNIIEYKSFNTRGDFEQKLKGLYKSIAAFLNSEGGLLVWGAPEGTALPGETEKSFTGPLTPINRVIEQDYLINKISDNITTLPNGIRTKIVRDNGNSVVVIEVDRSDTSPHQTENIYYFRLDGQTRKSPHSYIEAQFRQIKYPNLGGYIKFESIRLDGNNYLLAIKVFVINHTGLQNEENVTFRLTCDVCRFVNQYTLVEKLRLELDDHQLVHYNFAEVLHYGASPFCDATIMINPHRLLDSENRMKLILMFGGKKSPLKQSTYTLYINDIHPGNINDLVEDIVENQLMVEFAKDKGSETEKVNRILGRNNDSH